MADRLDYRMVAALVWTITEAPEQQIATGTLDNSQLGTEPQVDLHLFDVINDVLTDEDTGDAMKEAVTHARKLYGAIRERGVETNFWTTDCVVRPVQINQIALLEGDARNEDFRRSRE